MGRDEIVSTMAAERRITNPQDIAWLREDVERVCDLYEQPHRWVDEVKPTGECLTSEANGLTP